MANETMVLGAAITLLFLGIEIFLLTTDRPRWKKPVQWSFFIVAALACAAMIGGLVAEYHYLQKQSGAVFFFVGFVVSSAFVSMSNKLG